MKLGRLLITVTGFAVATYLIARQGFEAVFQSAFSCRIPALLLWQGIEVRAIRRVRSAET